MYTAVSRRRGIFSLVKETTAPVVKPTCLQSGFWENALSKLEVQTVKKYSEICQANSEATPWLDWLTRNMARSLRLVLQTGRKEVALFSFCV